MNGSIMSDKDPTKIIINVIDVWATNANIKPFSFAIPYRESASIAMKCHAPIPPCTGATMPKLASTKVVSPATGPKFFVKSKEKNTT